VAALSAAPADDPDQLYADRANPASAKRAAELWSAALTRDPGAFEAAWKLSRMEYWLGGHAANEREQRAEWERGIDAGRKAVAIEPTKPDGHFWLAANMGSLAAASGMSTGLKYKGAIKDELDTVLRIDPGFRRGSADRALGRWYAKVPRLFGGDRSSAERHLRASLTYDPQNTASHFFLSELYVDWKKLDEARAEAKKVIDAPLAPDTEPEDRDFKAKAAALLERLSSKR
jgi:hypothetical protein